MYSSSNLLASFLPGMRWGKAIPLCLCVCWQKTASSRLAKAFTDVVLNGEHSHIAQAHVSTVSSQERPVKILITPL